MSKLNTKKEQILWAGLEVMRSQGYNGTSVKDIVDAAEVPKGSFYNYFDSKESFAVEALEAYSFEEYETSRNLLSVSDKSPLQRLQHFFEKTTLHSCECEFKIGCFFGNMGQEMSDSNEAIRHKVKQILKRHTQMIAEILEEAKQAGEIRQSAETDMIAEFIFNAWEGTLMRMKATKSREPLDAILKMLPQIVG
jgi:TetR/AcrR family transcriptional repressor of nem operon